MEEKQINRWLRRRFTTVGWTLIAYYGIMNILVVLTMTLESLKGFLWSVAGHFPGHFDPDAVMNNAWGYILAILVGAVVLYAWKGGDYWRREIFARKKSMTAGVFLCLMCLCAGSQMVNSLWVSLLDGILNLFGRSVAGMLEGVSGSADSFSMFLYSGLLAPVAEEILFRGFVQRSLRPFGRRFAIFGSAFLFGLFHGNLLQTPYAFLVGLVLGYVAEEYSIPWSMGLHMFNNLILADFLSRILERLPQMAAAFLDLLIFGGFAGAAAVILAVKRREISAYRKGEWMDRRCLKCFFTNSGVLVLTVIMVVNMILLLLV